MANNYVLNWSDSATTPLNILGGTQDTTSTSLKLVGRGSAAGIWGVSVQQNFLSLLENFASSTAPSNAVIGQTWYDKASGSLKVKGSSSWAVIPDTTSLSNTHLPLSAGSTKSLTGPLYVSGATAGWGGWNHSIRLTTPGYAQIHSTAGGMGIGFHSNRNMYFIDEIGGKESATLNMNTGDFNTAGRYTNPHSIAVASEGSSHDIYGAINIVKPAVSDIPNYYSSVRIGQMAWGTGINASNNYIIGTASAQNAGHNGRLNNTFTFTTDGDIFSARFPTGLYAIITALQNSGYSSDEKLKTDWKVIQPDFVNKLSTIRTGVYNRIDMNNQSEIGVSAQSVQKLFPEATISGSDDILRIKPGLALAAVVELSKLVLSLQKEIEELKSKIK